MKKEVRLYNVLFPIWLLVWIPSFLWLALIPANYFIDRFVLYKSLSEDIDRKDFCNKNAHKICAVGFLCDFIGSALMFLTLYLTGEDYRLANAISFDPFSDLRALFIVIIMILVSGLLIYLIDKKVLTKAGLDAKQAHRSALFLAVFTAPYLFLIPSNWLYI